MTDANTRALQRQAATDPSAEATVIRARMRAGEWAEWQRCPGILHSGQVTGILGDLGGGCTFCHGTGYQPSEAAVELLAYCGHNGAREVLDWGFREVNGTRMYVVPKSLGWGAWAQWEADKDFAHWSAGLSRWGQECLVRAAVAAAREGYAQHAMLHWEGEGCDVCQRLTPEEAERKCEHLWLPLIAIETTEAWCEDPTEERREACEAAIAALPMDDNAWAWGPARLVAGFDHTEEPHWRGEVMRDVASTAARLTSGATVRAAICKALIEWVLD